MSECTTALSTGPESAAQGRTIRPNEGLVTAGEKCLYIPAPKNSVTCDRHQNAGDKVGRTALRLFLLGVV